MGLTTARDLIIKALKEIQVGAEGETLSAETMNDGLDSLNLMLGVWGGRGLATMAEIQETLLLTAAKVSYMIGVTSLALPTDINSAKPHRIVSAFVRDASNMDTPITLISREEYNALLDKTTAGLPELLFQDPGATQQTNHVMTFFLYPVPDATTTYTIHLSSEKPLTRIAALDSHITMPDHYISGIVPNLAIQIAPQYGKTLHPGTIKAANDSMSVIETINTTQKRTIIELGLPLSDTTSILTGP